MAGSLSHERAHLMHLSPASMNVECGAVLGRLVPRASPLPPETRRGMHMGTSCAVMNFQRYLEVHPYLGGGAAIREMPAGEALRQAERMGVSSVGAAALSADLLDRNILDFERSLVRNLGLSAGRNLSQVDVCHVPIDISNGITLYDPNDRSYAIGVDPGFWQGILFLYFDAALGQRVDDPRWFLILATKTVGRFWARSSKDSSEDLDFQINMARETAPDIWSFGNELVNTAISFPVAHEVGHIVLGHLQGPHAGMVRLAHDVASRASVMDSEELELEADAWAAEALFRQASNNFKLQTLALSVPALCFCLSALKSELCAPAANAIARAIVRSHPPEMVRAQQVHTLARSH